MPSVQCRVSKNICTRLLCQILLHVISAVLACSCLNSNPHLLSWTNASDTGECRACSLGYLQCTCKETNASMHASARVNQDGSEDMKLRTSSYILLHHQKICCSGKVVAVAHIITRKHHDDNTRATSSNMESTSGNLLLNQPLNASFLT